jgi:hypothetical protein
MSRIFRRCIVPSFNPKTNWDRKLLHLVVLVSCRLLHMGLRKVHSNRGVNMKTPIVKAVTQRDMTCGTLEGHLTSLMWCRQHTTWLRSPDPRSHSGAGGFQIGCKSRHLGCCEASSVNTGPALGRCSSCHSDLEPHGYTQGAERPPSKHTLSPRTQSRGEPSHPP